MGRDLRETPIATAGAAEGAPDTRSDRCGRPKIVGVGGTLRAGSATERALSYALDCAQEMGADVQLVGEAALSRLPMFKAHLGAEYASQSEFAEAITTADAVIIASPAYHGSISGLMKNALDTLELTRGAASPYLSGKAVGAIILADGPQAGGAALGALRSIVHALRGWPTPYGVTVQGGAACFDEAGRCLDPATSEQLRLVAEQVVKFARTTVNARGLARSRPQFAQPC